MICYFFFQAEDGIRDLVRSRGLGDVYKRQVPRGLDWDLWLGPAPWHDYTQERFTAFRAFMDYARGGELANWGVHLVDILHWGIRQDRPLTVQAVGGNYLGGTGADNYEVVDALLEYPGCTVTWEQHHSNTHSTKGYGMRFQGTRGRLTLDRGSFWLANLAPDSAMTAGERECYARGPLHYGPAHPLIFNTQSAYGLSARFRPSAGSPRYASELLIALPFVLPIPTIAAVACFALASFGSGMGAIATALALTDAPTSRATVLTLNGAAWSVGIALGAATGGLSLTLGGFGLLGVCAFATLAIAAGLLLLAAQARLLAAAGAAPLLLLDDLDTELDATRLAAVWRALAGSPQLLATSNRPEIWRPLPVAGRWRVTAGEVTAEAG